MSKLSLRYTTVEYLLVAAGTASGDWATRSGREASGEATREPSREASWDSSRKSTWPASTFALSLAGGARISSLIVPALDVEQGVILVLATAEATRGEWEAGSSGEPSREPRRNPRGEAGREAWESSRNPSGEPRNSSRKAGCALALATSELRGGDGRGSEECDE